MLIDMMKDVEKKTDAEPPPEPHRFAPADKEVIKGVVERIRGALLQEIQDMNAGNPALAMISLLQSASRSGYPLRADGGFDQAQWVRRPAQPKVPIQPRCARILIWPGRRPGRCCTRATR